MKQYYIYKVTNKINGKAYIGSHYGKTNDSYFGSGIAITRAVEKYGKENFIKEIIEIQPTKQLMLEEESYWLNKLKCSTNPEYYNMTNTAGGGCLIDGKTEEERKNIITKQAAGRRPKQKQITKKMLETKRQWNEKQKLKNKIEMSKSHKEAYARLTPEQKAARIKKISETKRNLPKWKKAITSKKHSERAKKWRNSLTIEQKIEYSKKLSESQKGKIISEEQKEQIRNTLKQYQKSLPKHIKEARRRHNSMVMSMMKWCNNGIKNFRKTPEQIKELGYTLGRL